MLNNGSYLTTKVVGKPREWSLWSRHQQPRDSIGHVLEQLQQRRVPF